MFLLLCSDGRKTALIAQRFITAVFLKIYLHTAHNHGCELIDGIFVIELIYILVVDLGSLNDDVLLAGRLAV